MHALLSPGCIQTRRIVSVQDFTEMGVTVDIFASDLMTDFDMNRVPDYQKIP